MPVVSLHLELSRYKLANETFFLFAESSQPTDFKIEISDLTVVINDCTST